jgi:hypothetical protein
MAYLFYGGTHNTNTAPDTFKRFCTWDKVGDTYIASTQLTIDTPNVTTLPAPNLGGITADGNFVGNIGNGNANIGLQSAGLAADPGQSLPTLTKNFASIGCILDSDYAALTTPFADEDGGYSDWNGGNTWTTPGMTNPDSDVYTMCILSTQRAGQGTATSRGTRVIYEAPVGQLAEFLSRLFRIGQLVIGSGSVGGGGIIDSSFTDEQAAACWLLGGYGLLKGGEPVFWEDAP